MQVIVADGNGNFRTLLSGLLRNEGYDVIGEAADGKALLALLTKARPDIICLDHELPHCECHAFLDTLHRHEAARLISVVLMTAEDAAEVRTEATHDGIAGFLHKPFSQAQVIEEMRQVAHARRVLARFSSSTVAAEAGGNSKARCRIVLADDSETQRKLLRAILEDAGCAVVGEADNGATAIELVRLHKPDLTCLDVEMPVMNGLDALSQIHAALPKLPVMMVTSHNEREFVRDAAVRGARGYIVKPYQPEKVREAIDRLIGETVAA